MPAKPRKPVRGLPPAAAAPSATVFKLKITLADIKPAIWRRVETPDCTLEALHEVIQRCFNWENYHMWEFAVSREERYGARDDEEMGSTDAGRVSLSQLAARGVKKIAYTYDFGDNWDHVITFEKPVARDAAAKYPRCVAGERAGPPEDCGGPWGYANLLDILADPKHEEYAERLEWVGGEFDPVAFDIKAVNTELAKLKHK